MEIKELIEKQKKKQFEKMLYERVRIEDLKRWAEKKTYVEIENEKLQNKKKIRRKK